jgi:S-formylglutathione hydrolase FrmB
MGMTWHMVSENEDQSRCTPAGVQTEKWKNYRMWSYLKDELPELLASDPNFSSLDTKTTSIFGHSMGGHGEADWL